MGVNVSDSDFYLRARIQMVKKNITMTKIAEDLGISVSYVSDIIRGLRPGGDHRERIEIMLGMEEIKSS